MVLLLAAGSVVALFFDPVGFRWAGVVGLAVGALLSCCDGPPRPRAVERRTVDGLRKLHPGEFEAEVGRWLRRDGGASNTRGGTGDGGIDIVAAQARRGARRPVQALTPSMPRSARRRCATSTARRSRQALRPRCLSPRGTFQPMRSPGLRHFRPAQRSRFMTKRVCRRWRVARRGCRASQQSALRVCQSVAAS